MFTFVLNVASLFTIKFWPIVIFFVISVFPVTFNNGPILAIVAFKVVISAVPIVDVSAFICVEVIFGTVKAPLIFTSLPTDILSFTLKSNISDLPIISKPSKPIILSLNSALLSTDKLPLSVTEFIKYDLDIITASPSTNNLFFILASLFTKIRLDICPSPIIFTLSPAAIILPSTLVSPNTCKSLFIDTSSVKFEPTIPNGPCSPVSPVAPCGPVGPVLPVGPVGPVGPAF